MAIFNFAANGAAIASLISTGLEAGETGIRNAKKSSETSLAVKDIKDMTGDSMLKKSSEKYNAMKKTARNWDFTPGLHKACGAISGFTRGFAKGIKNNIPSLGFSALTLAAKNKTAKTAGVIGVGVSTAWDFLKNGTNLFQKKDIIEK